MKYTPQKAANKRDRIPKGQSRETGNKGYTRRRQTNQKHSTTPLHANKHKERK